MHDKLVVGTIQTVIAHDQVRGTHFSGAIELGIFENHDGDVGVTSLGRLSQLFRDFFVSTFTDDVQVHTRQLISRTAELLIIHGKWLELAFLGGLE